MAEPAEAVKGARIVAFLTPDMVQKKLYEQLIDDIAEGATLLFAHGFAVHYKLIQPRSDLNCVLIAPKGPGGLVRRQYEEGHGVPCLVAVHQDADGNALALALAYAAAPGPVSSRPRSPRKPRPTCSASRLCSAAARQN